MAGKILTAFLFAVLGAFFGGNRIFSLVPLSALACAAFSVSLLSDSRGGLGILSRFPPFWIGMLFLAHLAVQTSNVWFVYEPHGLYNTSGQVPFCEFLPAGVHSGIKEFDSAWETFLKFFLAWVSLCAIRLNLRTRRDCLFFARAIFYSAVVISAAAAAYQTLWPQSHMIWGIFDRNLGVPYGGFFYKNQMGAYMILCGTCGLALFARALCKRERGRDLFLPAAGLALLSGSLLMSGSFGALCVWGAEALVAAAAFSAVFAIRGGSVKRLALIFAACLAALCVAAAAAAPLLAESAVGKRIERAFDGGGGFAEMAGKRGEFRMLARDMIKNCGTVDCRYRSGDISRAILGNGANSFAYISRIWPKDVSYGMSEYSAAPDTLRLTVLENAHCDILQFLFEYGALWFAVAAGMLIFWLAALFRRGALSRPFALVLAIGVLSVLFYSYFDIILYNAVVLTFFLTLAAMANEYLRLSENGGRPHCKCSQTISGR
ncbi:MAG: hypothetical protein DBX55_02840 [Verrucomicrobia bacterium]|nr:MAG: hypothetical protein DBX55_02840 [Verrucomicrobiota bacterium]